MITTILGLLLLLAPFLLIFCFDNRYRGFLYIFSASVVWHLLIALITQSLNIFTYEVIISLNILIALVSLFYLIKKIKPNSFRISLNYLAIAAFLIIIFELWSVHYFYTGAVNTINGPIEKTRASNQYPYFSDEWVGVALVNFAIENKSLPNNNPLIEKGTNNHFSNVLVCFFSIVAEIFLLLNLNPLTGYPILTIFSGFLVCLLVYIFLKLNKLKDSSAILATLFIPLITNGSNLPGIWYFIPFVGGVILFIVSLSALTIKDQRLFYLSAFLASILYPPIILFIFGSFFINIITKKNENNKLRSLVFGSILFLVSALIIIILQKIDFWSLIKIIKSTIFYTSLDPGIASYPIWLIIPFIALPFSIFGLYILVQKKMYFLLAPIISGLILWLTYSQSNGFFVISYERNVVITSYLLIISSAFAWDYLLEKLSKQKPVFRKPIFITSLGLIIITIFAIHSLSYTEKNNWSVLTFKLENRLGTQSLKPNPPANQYLTNEDLNIFTSIKNKNFLSLPWKALVVGAATNNYPLDSKPSFITNYIVNYGNFMNSDCQEKEKLAKKNKLHYVYSTAFACNNFIELKKSQEGLYLYKFNK